MLFRVQTTGITSRYLQARLRNILQEEGISSRCSEPPYLLKGISNLDALKDTYPAPFLGKDQRNLHAKRNELLDANRKCQKLVQASSTRARLGETMEYYQDKSRKNNTDKRNFLSRHIKMTCYCGNSKIT